MSYEGLLSLSTLLGDVKPRGTPADIISSLPKGTYGEWVRPGHTEERCPICLDDVCSLSYACFEFRSLITGDFSSIQLRTPVFVSPRALIGSMRAVSR